MLCTYCRSIELIYQALDVRLEVVGSRLSRAGSKNASRHNPDSKCDTYFCIFIPVIIMHDVELDDNPRPLKRQRQNTSLSPSSSFSSAHSTAVENVRDSDLAPIPAPYLLLALPRLLIHPPTHKYHLKSLFIAQRALRRCLALPESQLDRDVECRAWTALAEIGVQCLAMGKIVQLNAPQDAIETEVEKALTKAVSTSY
jgi:hypothetical protein